MVRIPGIVAKLFEICKENDVDHIESVVRNTDTDEVVAGVFVTTHPGLTKAVEKLIERYTE